MKNDTMNMDALFANAKSVAVAAASKLPQQPKKPKKGAPKRELALFYTLSATPLQVHRDPRLALIKEFLDATNPRRRGQSPRKDFIVQALFDAIIAKSK